MLKDSFYTSPEWRTLRASVLNRDRHKCTVARLLGGACGGTLHVHHIVPVDEDSSLALDPDNCASACAVHHPRWEALRRALMRTRKAEDCGHYHPYVSGREACRRRRERAA